MHPQHHQRTPHSGIVFAYDAKGCLKQTRYNQRADFLHCHQDSASYKYKDAPALFRYSAGLCAEQIEQYNLCFPKGKKAGTSSSFRTNPKELVERFSWFFKEYPEYTWENVLEATKLYTKQFLDSNDFTYLQLSKYFIKKDDKNKTTTSSLANVCYNIAQGNVSDVNDGYHYFGAD